MHWLVFALMTVACWGCYGVLLHTGQLNMADPVNGRFKAYLCVGVAYFLVAIIGPSSILLAKGASWSMPTKGLSISILAGTVGAIGAFGILLAFGAKGTPPVVMSIVFAGAPIINAIVSMIQHPPAGGISAIRWPFVAGILMAALGGALVTLYKPPAAPGQAKARQVQTTTTAQASPGGR